MSLPMYHLSDNYHDKCSGGGAMATNVLTETTRYARGGGHVSQCTDRNYQTRKGGGGMSANVLTEITRHARAGGGGGGGMATNVLTETTRHAWKGITVFCFHITKITVLLRICLKIVYFVGTVCYFVYSFALAKSQIYQAAHSKRSGN